MNVNNVSLAIVLMIALSALAPLSFGYSTSGTGGATIVLTDSFEGLENSTFTLISGAGFSASSMIAQDSITVGGLPTYHAAIPINAAGGITGPITIKMSATLPQGYADVVINDGTLRTFPDAIIITRNATVANITADVSSCKVGDTINVLGTGYPANTTIGALGLNGTALTIADAGAGTVAGNAITVDANGAFQVSFVMPPTPAGVYYIDTASPSASNNATIVVMPSMHISSTTVSAGEVITITLDGYGASTVATAYWDGTATATTITTSATGSATFTFTIPSTSGNHTLSVRDAYGNSVGPTTVFVSALIVKKTLNFYLHRDLTTPDVNNIDALDVMDTEQKFGESVNVSSNHQISQDWYLTPKLAEDFEVSGTFSLLIWLNYTYGSTYTANPSVTVYERLPSSTSPASNPTDEVVVASANFAQITMRTSPTSYRFNITNVHHTFGAGSTIHVKYEMGYGAATLATLFFNSSYMDSRVSFEALDYLTVEDVTSYNSTGAATIYFSPSKDSMNSTVTLNATLSDPLGGYDIEQVIVNITDPSGAVIFTQNMTLVDGTPISSPAIYQSTWNYFGMPIGRYNVTVWAIDNNGFYYNIVNYNYGVYPSIARTFVLIGLLMPYNVSATAVDSNGAPLSGAYVALHAGLSLISDAYTNSSGCAMLYAFGGDGYNISVTWKGVVVNRTIVSISSDIAITFDCAVYNPSFIVVDSHDVPLSTAAAYFTFPDGTHTAIPFVTDDTGYVNMSQMPMGNYLVTAWWRGVIVYNDSIAMSANAEYEVDCAVYYLTAIVVDRSANPLPMAQVVICNSTTKIVTDSRMTNVSGAAVSRLPLGSYDVSAYWYNALVYDGTLDYLLTSDDEMTLVCEIFNLTTHAFDSHGIVLENAEVIIADIDMGMIYGTEHTDAFGNATVRLPAGSFDITIYWLGRLVNVTRDVMVSSDTSLDVFCLVNYVTFTAVDSHNATVKDAQLAVATPDGKALFCSGLTDALGQYVARVPEGECKVTVYWHDTHVNTTVPLNISSDMSWTVHCAIFYLDLTAMDKDTPSLPLGDATVVVTDATTGSVWDSQKTDSAGKMLSRLPGKDYNITIYWEGVKVHSSKVTFGMDMPIEAKCDVFTLTVSVKGSDSAPVNDAQIVVLSSSGALAGSGMTKGKGTIAFRLPIGSYTVKMRYITTYQMTAVDISKKADVTLSSPQEVKFTFSNSEYPLPIYTTTMFTMLIAILALVIMLAIILLLMLKYRNAVNNLARNAGVNEKSPKDEPEKSKGANEEKTEEKPAEHEASKETPEKKEAN